MYSVKNAAAIKYKIYKLFYYTVIQVAASSRKISVINSIGNWLRKK